MMTVALLVALQLIAGPTALEAGDNSPPPPTVIDDAGVQAWLARYIRTDGWTIIAADEVAVVLGSPGGVAVMPDDTLRAEIRHEYYSPTLFGPTSSRSNLQTWRVDCEGKRVSVVAMEVFALNNLQGPSERRENPQAAWSPAEPGSARGRTVERVCRAPHDGEALPVD